MAGRPKQVIINDLVNEFDVFGSRVVAIRDAIQSKGVTSEGKFSKFAEEINSIETAITYSYVLSAIKQANSKGYSDSDIVGILNNLPDKNRPPEPEEPIGEDYVNDSVLKITYDDVKKAEKAKRITFSNATSIDFMTFTNFNFEKVNLPKVAEINDDYAFSRSSIKELNMPSLIWDGTSKPDITSLESIEVLVVSEKSNISDWVFNKFSGLIIYNPDKTKKWDMHTHQWVTA